MQLFLKNKKTKKKKRWSNFADFLTGVTLQERCSNSPQKTAGWCLSFNPLYLKNAQIFPNSSFEHTSHPSVFFFLFFFCVHRDQPGSDQTSTDLLKCRSRKFCWSREAQYLYLRRLSSRSYSAIMMVCCLNDAYS